MKTQIFGIKNCDTMKKAMRWLTDNDIDFHFHDYRKDGLEAAQLTVWLGQLGWENLINKRGTTWRKLADDIKQNMSDELALSLLQEQPALIKRPLLLYKETITLGFSNDSYAALYK